ncbi:MAG: pyrimidine 5'-nucleotidase [Sphingomonas bacterium]|nr:pyrimidine 5'-nucleotidase [Sphingomonas bacterium]
MTIAPAFAHVADWIFDLDNCLYPASTGLFDLVDERMGRYIERLLECDRVEARRVQKAHFRDHGTTLAGLMKHHDVDPYHFLADVHDIELDRIAPNPLLDAGLGRLPGRKYLFTNGDAPYARRVLDRLGVAHHFEHLHDIHAAELRPKPDMHGYQLLIEQLRIDPMRTAMVEDMAQNLAPAKRLGMTTVWVDNGSERGNHGYDPAVVDHRISNVADWLDEILKGPA